MGNPDIEFLRLEGELQQARHRLGWITRLVPDATVLSLKGIGRGRRRRNVGRADGGLRRRNRNYFNVPRQRRGLIVGNKHRRAPKSQRVMALQLVS
jgi:hypothetical protein